MKPIKSMPSILGDVTPPFSQQTHTGVADDFATVHQQWQKNQTPEMNTQMLSKVQPTIDTAISSYGGQSASPAIKTRAKLMALKALQNFDPARGNVRTHLLSQMQSLRRMSAQEQNIISIPEQVGLDYQKLTESERSMQDRLSRDPTDNELADETGLSVRRIGKIRSFHQPLAEGTTVNENSEEHADGGDMASKIPGQTSAQDAWINFVHGDLTPTNQLIMDMLLGRNGRKKTSVQEIARKLNITSGAVSQRAAKIQELLNKNAL